MTPTPEALRYTTVSKSLHWLIALLVFALLAMGKLGEVDDEPLFAWHTGVGLLVLVLMVARLGWRLTHAVPPLPATTPGWQQAAARGLHWAFYGLLLLLPLTGWAITSIEGDAVSLLGLPMPALPVPGGEAAEDIVEETHEILGNVLLVLALVHVAAGLKHHFVDRDDVLRRMLPG